MDKKEILKIQCMELTDQIVYKKLAELIRESSHKDILKKYLKKKVDIIGFLKISLTKMRFRISLRYFYLYSFRGFLV